MTRRYNPYDESIFLQQQAADAKLAMQHTLTDMRDTALALSDIPAWAQQYPWLTTGAACAAGFVTSVVLTSSPHRSAEANANTSNPSSLTASLRSALFGFLRSTLLSAVASAVYAQTQPPDPTGPEMSD